MNNPNPLVPQGTLTEQKKHRRTRVLITVMGIIALHVIPITTLLFMQGCKRETPSNTFAEAEGTNNFLPPLDAFYTNFPPLDTATTTTTTTTTTTPATTPTTTPTTLAARDTASRLTPRTTLPPPPEAFSSLPSLPAGRVTEHVVVRGDTFSSLAKKYGTTVKAITEANPAVDPQRLMIGQKILVPPSSATAQQTAARSEPAPDPNHEVYVVRRGDSLSKIAREYGTTVRALRSANNLTSDRILVGQKLLVPKSRSETLPPNTAPATTPAANRVNGEDFLRKAVNAPAADIATSGKELAGTI
jgi:LysM repeat protein